MLILVLGGFKKGVGVGIIGLLLAAIYLTLFLCFVNLLCKQSDKAGWVAGSICIVCGIIVGTIISQVMNSTDNSSESDYIDYDDVYE